MSKGLVFDFRLSEKDSNHRAQDLLFILSPSIENLKLRMSTLNSDGLRSTGLTERESFH